jgi:hypothetical protein
MLKTITISFLIGLLLLPVCLRSYALAMDPEVEKTINHLLEVVEESHCTFIRNDEEHDSKYAAQHIKKKYDYFKDKIDTPEEFIELCATKSLMSGRPYVVRCEGDRKTPTADWLKTALDDYRRNSQQASSTKE